MCVRRIAWPPDVHHDRVVVSSHSRNPYHADIMTLAHKIKVEAREVAHMTKTEAKEVTVHHMYHINYHTWTVTRLCHDNVISLRHSTVTVYV